MITVWLTRDADPDTGAPADLVDVWSSRPVYYLVGDRGTFWLDSTDDLAARIGQWTLRQTEHACGTTPDDGRMCVRCGL